VTRLLEHLAGETGEREPREVESPTDLKFVGPATGEAIDDADFSATDLVEKSVSYSMLLEAGVNPGVAAKIRRYHSLSWSFDTSGDLNRRSEQVRGLQDDERAWVAQSGLGDEDDVDGELTDPEALSAPGTDDDTDDEAAWVANAGGDGETTLPEDGDETDEEAVWVADATADDESTTAATADGSGDPLAAEAAWRERSKPTPLTEISGVGEEYNEQLAEAGVTSVRSLATASPELLSDVTGIPEQQLRAWHHEASRMAD
jgi:predicted flap endonuclease-1-like 5' DNA nuclease